MAEVGPSAEAAGAVAGPAWRPRARESAILALGVALVLAGALLGTRGEWRTFLQSIGSAFVGGVLVLILLELRAREDAAKDLFHQMMGYPLPEPLRPQPKWLCNQQILCDRSRDVLVLSRERELIRIERTMERRLLNVSATPAFVPLLEFPTLQRMAFPPPTITALRWREDGDPDWTDAHPDQLLGLQSDGSPGRVGRAEIRCRLRPGRSLTWRAESIDHHRPNDSVTILFTYPTDSPEVQVRVPDDIRASVRFPHLSDATVSSGADVHVFPGVLLPNAALVVRWWETGAGIPDAPRLGHDSSRT